MEWPKELLDAFADPMFDNVKPKVSPMKPDDRMCKKLEEINTWIDKNGRIPSSGGDLKEKLLSKSLDALKEHADLLSGYDRHGVLKK